jgi:hypothetical protein
MSLYVYAFVGAPGATMRIAGRRIEILRVKGLNVAVERMDAPPRISETFLLAQHSIVERLCRAFDAVLPTRFGAWHEPAALADEIDSRARGIREGLRHVRGRAQMTIRLVSPAAPDPLPAAQPVSGTAYLARRKAALSQQLPAVVDSIRAAVDPFVAEERLDVDVERGRTAVYHLIRRTDAPQYRRRVSKIIAGEKEVIAVGGPYAAYAFAPEVWP